MKKKNVLRELRERLVDLNVRLFNEAGDYDEPFASILSGIQEGLASGIADLNEAMGLDAYGNDKPE